MNILFGFNSLRHFQFESHYTMLQACSMNMFGRTHKVRVFRKVPSFDLNGLCNHLLKMWRKKTPSPDLFDPDTYMQWGFLNTVHALVAYAKELHCTRSQRDLRNVVLRETHPKTSSGDKIANGQRQEGMLFGMSFLILFICCLCVKTTFRLCSNVSEYSLRYFKNQNQN